MDKNEKFEFQSEEELKMYRMLLSPREAIEEAWRQGEMVLAENEMEKTHKQLKRLGKDYSWAFYDVDDKSRFKRICGRVFGKVLKLIFTGPFAKKQIAYNRQVLTTLTSIQQTQEAILQILVDMKNEEEQ